MIKRNYIFQIFFKKTNISGVIKNTIILLLLLIIIILLREKRHHLSTHVNTLYKQAKAILNRKTTSDSFFVGSLRNPENINIDWHDYAFMKYEEKRVGLGEHGMPAHIIYKDENLKKKLYAANGYNGYLSDLISVNRSLPDYRPAGCKHKKYLSNLPTVSIIIPIYNEHFSVVMRTAHSMLNRSPPHLIREVIFVNDLSDEEFLNQTEMNQYVAQQFAGKGKVIHLALRLGLIQARMAGATIASGDVYIFSDAHTEATVNWLPPLLNPIAKNYRVCTVPMEDGLDWQYFGYPGPEGRTRSIFDWQLNFIHVPVLPEDLVDDSKPYKSPLMKGGLFAISSKFFWELGGYDDQLEIWGGEQFEMSFKVWQCGGEMYDVPCSRFGHMFRMDGRQLHNPRPYNFIARNYKRVVEVWMDEYKEFIYMRSPDAYNIDAGDLTRQKAVREQLKCKSFKWFLENVATEVLPTYPVLGLPWFAKGVIRSLGDREYCVDTLSLDQKPIGMYACSKNSTHPGANQRFELSFYRDIAYFETRCLQVSENIALAPVIVVDCNHKQGNQFWRYEEKTDMLLHDTNRTFCMETDPTNKTLFINYCNNTNMFQKWEWGLKNQTMLENWLTTGAALL